MKKRKLKNQFQPTKIDASLISVRAYNCLRSLNIQTIDELSMKTEKELLKTKHLGRKTLKELKNLLNQYNLKLKGE